MKDQESGLILFISSTSGLHGVPLVISLCDSKMGLNWFNKTLAMELGPKGIRVNAICPGSVEGEQ